MVGEILGLIALGVVVGALGRLIHRGREQFGVWSTIAIGIASAVLVGVFVDGIVLSFVLAVVVAVALVALYSAALARSTQRRA
jgi:hypothetical protein